MQLGALIECAQTLAVSNLFFTIQHFSDNKFCRAAWIEDLYNILKYFLPQFSLRYFLDEGSKVYRPMRELLPYCLPNFVPAGGM